MVNHNVITLLDYFNQNDLQGLFDRSFVFTPELLTQIERDLYPIYDSFHAIMSEPFAIVFQKGFVPDESFDDHNISIYSDIVETYMELRRHHIINTFRTRFGFKDMESEKILDLLFWRLGSLLNEEGLEQSPQEYLEEKGIISKAP